MNSDKKGNDSQSSSNPSVKRGSRSHIVAETQTSGDKEKTENKTAHQETKPKPQPIVINIPPVDNTEPQEANRIARNNYRVSMTSVMVNTALCVATLILAGVAIWQYNTSKNATQIAQKTLDETHKYDSTSLAMQRESFKAQADIFKLMNEPFVQIVPDSLNSVKQGVFEFMYDIETSSQRPIEVVNQVGSLFIVTSLSKKDSLNFIKNPFKRLEKRYKINSYYFNRSKPFRNSCIEQDTLGFIKSITEGSIPMRLFFVGQIEYINYVTKKKRRYECVIELFFENKKLGWSYPIERTIDE